MRRFIYSFTALFVAMCATACGDNLNPDNPPPPPSPQLGLWTASGSLHGMLRLSARQLADSNAIDAAATSITTPSGEMAMPTGIAFDAARHLWVANGGDGTLVRFDVAQRAASGNPVPPVIITGLGRPIGIAFDAFGTLWVADRLNQRILGFRPQQLVASGASVPAVIITASDSSLNNPSGLAFDEAGTLWVVNSGSQKIAGFTAAQLAQSGSPAPRVELSGIAGSLNAPIGLAFDQDKSLWVMNRDGRVEKFAHALLAGGGAPAPTKRFSFHESTVFWGLAFFPVPTGLPIR